MTTRREFLTQAALLTTCALATTESLMAKPDSRVGLQLYSLREQLPKDIKGVITKVAAAGYKEVETYGYSKQNGFWGMNAGAFSQLLKHNGLTTPSGHYGLDQYLTGGQLDELNYIIEAAKTTGQTYITVPSLGSAYPKSFDGFKSTAEKLNKAGELCKRAGLALAYHNHAAEFKAVNATTLYEVLLTETDKNLVQFEMDLYWVVRAGQSPVSIMQRHPGRFAMVHIKDMDKTKPELNTEVGAGSINFKEIVANANSAGIKHFIVEQENFSIDPYQSITQSCSYVKNSLL
jgi:sugar phosphate isomerase/epimerase